MKIDVTGKTVYILGAGASHHTGAPLLRDFMVTARWLYETQADLEKDYKDSFKIVIDWMDKLRSSSYYIDFDLDNIEHLFSIAEMMKQLNRLPDHNFYSHLKNVIMVTLDICQVIKWSGDHYIPDPIYSTFISKIKAFNTKRRTINIGSSFDADSIITFNYDVGIDYCMLRNNIGRDYCLGDPIPDDDIVLKLLKLHGSSHFAKCRERECNNPYQLINLNKAGLDGLDRSGSIQLGPIGSGMVSKILKKEKCSNCNKTSLDPLIIPPTWSKDVEDHPLSRIWSSAVDEINRAQQIVVIGYSLPQTDTFFQYLLTLALEKNNNMNRVVVVNTDSSDGFKLRYKRIFSRSLYDRGRLIFIDESWKDKIINRPGAPFRSGSQIIMDFKTYIDYFMDDIMKWFN